eukprot:3017921-Amphidinium_carterae.1
MVPGAGSNLSTQLSSRTAPQHSSFWTCRDRRWTQNLQRMAYEASATVPLMTNCQWDPLHQRSRAHRDISSCLSAA